MNALSRLWRQLFSPDVEADPRITAAVDAVDQANERLGRALDVAERRGVFDTLRRSLVQSAIDDEARIRRERRRG